MSLSDTQGPIPGWSQILSGVDVKTASWADAGSIGKRLYDAKDPDNWETQDLRFEVNGNVATYKYNVPPDFQVASFNDLVAKDFIGQDRDEYMSALIGSFNIKGSYGGFSGRAVQRSRLGRGESEMPHADETAVG
jgi:hypothetical protein